MGGGSSSPRSVTMEQDDASGVVKVSEAVARRLVGKPENADTTVVSPDTSRGVSQSEIEAEIQKISARYNKRIRELEKQNKTLHQTTTEQFARAVEEVEQKFLKTTAAPICDDLQNQVMKCYQDNAKQTLHCSQIVKAYSSCVQNQRQSILTKKDEDCQPCLLAQMARGPCGVHFMKAYDCYLEGGDEEECAQRYLTMKDCWDKHPDYGYHKIVDKAYADDKPAKNTTDENRTGDTQSKPNSNTEVKSNGDNLGKSGVNATGEDLTQADSSERKKL